MTPYQFVHKECANFVNGECIMREPGACFVGQGKRCSYFEESLLPLADLNGSKHAAKYRTSVLTYRRQVMKPGSVVMTEALLCECGQLLPTRRRVCDKCRARKRKEAYRRRQRQNRESMLPAASVA